MSKKIAVSCLLILFLSILIGCHTVKGVGEDVESTGRAIERSSGK